MKETIKLTQFSHGAGCGCKISAAMLSTIIKGMSDQKKFPKLLIGNQTSDDAAVLDLGNGQAIISTTDFFMPIVDDPFDFGRIAAVNAISDVYAMGGRPLIAIAILGWPVDKISLVHATTVLEGGKTICAEAGIPLAGGHSIDSPEPLFGLAVTGIIEIKNIKANSTAKAADLIYITKPLGVGIICTASKKGIVENQDLAFAIQSMTKLSTIGETISCFPYVNAMTDVTGFGLAGHLIEMCESSGLTAELDFDKIPLVQNVNYYIEKKTIPGGTNKNWKSYGHHIGSMSSFQQTILCDPQTSGGLLISINPNYKNEFEKTLTENQYYLQPIGRFTVRKENLITIKA